MALYQYLPNRYIPYDIVNQVAVLLNISPERAEQYLRMLELFKLVRRVDTFTFEKVEKTQKKLKIEDLDDLTKPE